MESNMSSFSRSIALISLLWLVFFLAIWNLDTYPSTWFDEGIFLQPPKNLILYGKYALKEGDLFHPFSSYVTTGPPLLLPVAFVFRLIGIDLWQARFVTVSYLMLTAVVFYKLARQLYGHNVGLLALGLIIGSPGLGFVSWGRQVMGEVPSLFFFLLATLIWVYASRRRRLVLLPLVGFALGMAMITRSIYAINLPICWLLLWVADRWHYRQLGFVYYLLPLCIGLMCVAAWYGCQFAGSGFTAMRQSVLETGTSAGRSIFIFAPARMFASLEFLFGPNFYLAFGIPGLIYNLYLSIRAQRSLLELQRVSLLMITLVWLAWYVFASIGWQRYSFPALIITALFAANLFLDLGFRLVRALQSGMGQKQGVTAPMVRATCLVALIVLFCFFPFYRTSLHEEAVAMLDGNDDAPRRFADYLTAHVALDDVIHSWEWELDFFTDHTYYHPPPPMVDVMVRHVYLGEPYSYDMYGFKQIRPHYIIDGPFSKWTGLYSPVYLSQECTLVVSIGAYDLYRANK
jgi:4-amino-4-deoxy-L-arabinose transferase-like glycosyltransferase